jgi:hypothetical protein
VPLAEVGAELLFQVIAERAERATVIIHNEPSLLGMDSGLHQRAVVEGGAGPHHGPCTHHRDRIRFLSVPAGVETLSLAAIAIRTAEGGENPFKVVI